MEIYYRMYLLEHLAFSNCFLSYLLQLHLQPQMQLDDVILEYQGGNRCLDV